MTLEHVQIWILIIGTLTTAIVSIITALRVKIVHTLVNSAMAHEKAENSILHAMLVAKQLEIDAMEKVRLAITATQPSVTTLPAEKDDTKP